jgi:glycosyltransferase involved in cell wall biosynthesis
MKIGFDISQTGRLKAGCGYFAQSLIESLSESDTSHEYMVYPAFGTRFWDPHHATETWRSSRRHVHRGPEGMSHAANVALWQSDRRELEARLGAPDLIHANNFYCPRGLNARIVFTLYDLVVFDYPDFSTEANRLVCTDGILDAAVNADMLIAISDATRARFLELFPHYPPSRVRTVYPASRFAAGQPTAELPSPLAPHAYWLAVGTVEPRKNLRRLVQAYAALVREWPDTPPLVIAGGQGWLEQGFDRFVEELGIGDRVHRLGYVDDPILAALYANCFAFVYPSLVEGFGLPVLEAMTLGAATITSNCSSLPEIAGDAALTVDPEDEAALSAAMLTLKSGDSRDTLRSRAQRRAARFSWRAAARAVSGIYEEVRLQPRFVESIVQPPPGPCATVC